MTEHVESHSVKTPTPVLGPPVVVKPILADLTDPNAPFIPMSPTQVPHGVPKNESVWQTLSDADKAIEDKVWTDKTRAPKAGVTPLLVTETMKDELIQAFIDEHKKFNGIPRYTTVEGACIYFGVKPAEEQRSTSDLSGPSSKLDLPKADPSLSKK